MKIKNIITVIVMVFIASISIKAQNKTITLSGIVECSDMETGALHNVHVYNKTNKLGTTTNKDGKFSIKMGQTDTLIFSTVQHIELVFIFDKNQPFQDEFIEIKMEQDTIWLEAVSVVGFMNYEEFKRELLQLDLPNNDISLAIPVINKFAKQNASGEGALNVSSSLTHLAKKIHLIETRKSYYKK